jgi:hypothetical protein
LHNEANVGVVNLFREDWIDRSKISQGEGLEPHDEGSYHTKAETLADRFRDSRDTMTLGDMIKWVQAYDFVPESSAVVSVDNRKYAIKLQMTPIQDVESE